MGVTVYCKIRLDEASEGDLRARLDDGVELIQGEMSDQAMAADVFVDPHPDPEVLAKAPNLRAVIVPWTGIPHATQDAMRGFPSIGLHNLHYNAGPVAEMAMTLLLAAAKHLVPIDQALRRHDWRPRYEPSPSIMLEGKLALIYGYGAIGKRVARGCIGLGMEAVGIRRKVTVAYEDGAVRVTDPSELPDLLPRTTALMVCLPQTSETTGVIGREELAVLPKESVVVNVGRGELIEEQALYEALAEGRVHSAGMDVWYEYPKDRESRGNTPAGNYPFHELDNLVMSPHRGALGGEAETMRMTELAELLNAAARGETIPNRVDVAIGY